jgi:thioredoxin 1
MARPFSEIINGELPVLVDFSAEWCGPCKMMAPILKQLKDIMGDEVTIIKVDVDHSPDIAAPFHITGVPTLILFQQGKILWRQSGVMSAVQLKEIINSKVQA